MKKRPLEHYRFSIFFAQSSVKIWHRKKNVKINNLKNIRSSNTVPNFHPERNYGKNGKTDQTECTSLPMWFPIGI